MTVGLAEITRLLNHGQAETWIHRTSSYHAYSFVVLAFPSARESAATTAPQSRAIDPQ